MIMRGKHVLHVCKSLDIADNMIEFYESHKLERKNYLHVAKRPLVTNKKDWLRKGVNERNIPSN
jgi:hypothetical protein